MKIFIDTSGFLALFIKTDRYHLKALEVFKKLYASDYSLVCSSDVISETINFISKKHSQDKAIKCAEELLSGNLIEVIDSSMLDRQNALVFMKNFHDQKLSFTDLISFSIIDRMKIKISFSFDSDFNLMKDLKNLAFL